jgi:hypothetical protein
VKVIGFALVVLGIYGWWQGKPDFQWVVALGGGMITSGKFSVHG